MKIKAYHFLMFSSDMMKNRDFEPILCV